MRDYMKETDRWGKIWIWSAPYSWLTAVDTFSMMTSYFCLKGYGRENTGVSAIPGLSVQCPVQCETYGQWETGFPPVHPFPYR